MNKNVKPHKVQLAGILKNVLAATGIFIKCCTRRRMCSQRVLPYVTNQC